MFINKCLGFKWKFIEISDDVDKGLRLELALYVVLKHY